MVQSKFTADGSHHTSVRSWIENHTADYQQTVGRLEKVRNKVLNGRLTESARVLRLSYVNAVYSIRTDKDRHETAFVAWQSGDISVGKAAEKTVYGNQKREWIEDTFERIDWKNVAIAVRNHVKNNRYQTLLNVIEDKLKGVAFRKGAFMLAMSGLWEYMCVDSNVLNIAGRSDEDTEDNSLSYNNAKEYMHDCEQIRNNIVGDINYPPFVIQWAIYDFSRGEHARHMVYFNEVLE